MAEANDASSLSFSEQFRSTNSVFWIANAMEMLERLAYYGLRTVLPIYMVLSVQSGGPEFDHIQKGTIFFWWAAVQSFLPVFTGGYADRYGYKLTVAISIAIKVVGYLIMAFAVDIASQLSGGVSDTVAGHPTTYAVFLAGALFLAAGTAIFKPGLQGIIATQLNKDNASLGWALFYQLVNVGGFLGPYLASAMRLLDWKWVFVSCAVIVSLNYGVLLTFAEPDKHLKEEDEANQGNGLLGGSEGALGFGHRDLRTPHHVVLSGFSGFWMMFYQLFDLLPNFIDDWVDSSAVFNAVVVPLFGLFGSAPPEVWGGQVPQEQMINLNAGMIMILAFVVGYFTSRMRSMTAMIAGILVSTIGIAGLGLSFNGWVVLGMIVVFSLGEMMASPTKMRYFAQIAPAGKKGLYLGYVNATVGIGWSVGSLIAGELYQKGGDKVVLARRYLTEELGQAASTVDALPKDDVLPTLAQAIGDTSQAAQVLLWDTYSPQSIWFTFAVIGIISMFGLIAFDLTTRYANDRQEPWLLMALTGVISLLTYGPWWASAFVVGMALWLGLRAYAPGALPGGSDEHG